MLINSGTNSNTVELADAIGKNPAYVSRLIRLTSLAPDIVKMIWENRQPVSLTLDKLRHGIPDSWEEQRKLFLGE